MEAKFQMLGLKSFIATPVGIAVTVLVPCAVALVVRWLAGPLSVGAWVGVAIGILFLVPVLVVVTMMLQVTVFTPDWVERYPNGKVQARGPHYHGDRQEHWTFYYESGEKESEGKYVAGFESGEWSFWHRNGQLRARGRLDDGGYKSGDWVYGDEAGRPLGETEFLARHLGDSLHRWPRRRLNEETEPVYGLPCQEARRKRGDANVSD